MTTGKIILITIASVLLIIGIPIGIWAFTVATADIKGEGDKIIEKESSENFIAAQAFFEDTYAEFDASLDKITLAKVALEADPTDPTLRTNLSGAQNHCVNVAADYNAESRKYLSEEFKSADLPAKLDSSECLV